MEEMLDNGKKCTTGMSLDATEIEIIQDKTSKVIEKARSIPRAKLRNSSISVYISLPHSQVHLQSTYKRLQFNAKVKTFSVEQLTALAINMAKGVLGDPVVGKFLQPSKSLQKLLKKYPHQEFF